jgi:hypothetical protein
MRIYFLNFFIILFLVFVTAFTAPFSLEAVASETDGTIISPATNARGFENNVGYVNFGTSEGNVHVTDAGITGYAWSENMGWINLSPTNGGVTNDAEGNFIFSEPAAGLADARVREWWQKAMTGEIFVSPVYVSAITRQPCLTVSVPILQNTTVIGIIGADVGLE